MKRKILHLIPTLSSGGAERQLVNVVSNTSNELFTHLVCTFTNSSFFAPEIEEKGHTVKELGITQKRPWFAAARKFLDVINDYKPDLINSWLFDADITTRLSKIYRNLNIPLVTSLQSTAYDQETILAGGWSPLKVKVLKQLDKLTMKLTRPYFAACSHTVKKSFQRHLGIDLSRTKVIYNSITPESLISSQSAFERIRKEFEVPLDGFLYLNVGRLDKRKNQTFLIRAFAEVLHNKANVFMIIVGAGDLEKDLKTQTKRLGIEDKVRFAGRRSDIPDFLQAANAFVFPSLTEGLPLV
ncbi:MAG: glycosyltransferase [Acidobacteria bacterium]|jgi:glycosyltransferase involved in cell wall biosynthesis|nr:MAG: glycosyltransferase [Acidobacteriota bacterium]GIU81089.1 MAG: hypothetical protein KatS3mg006_0153 [Pyrinomonadaceae bacterium]